MAAVGIGPGRCARRPWGELRLRLFSIGRKRVAGAKPELVVAAARMDSDERVAVLF
jgi:hypothetical protein